MKPPKRFDRLAEALRDVSPERLREALVKEESITLRVTFSDKTDMQRVAKACKLTLTEYLTRLHLFASQRLFIDKNPTPSSRQKAH
jgi:hypothetical protein